MDVDSYPYNDDLLSTASDQAFAKQAYGPLAFALIFPQLLEKFAEADAVANAAKRRLRRNGLLSIALVTVALATASAAPLYEKLSWAHAIVVVAAGMGVAGSLGGLGLFSSKAKEAWLQNRLVTESLRQTHFKTLIQLAPEILVAAAAVDAGSPITLAFQDYDARRQIVLGEMDQDLIKRAHEQLDMLVEPGTQRTDAEPTFAVGSEVFESAHGAQLLNAYGRLRIRRQLQYADHKLSRKGCFFSSFPRVQASTLGTASAVCVALLLGLHIVSALMVISADKKEIVAALDLAAIWTALLALALRAIDEGLKPHTEVERYLHYRAVIERIEDRFENGSNAAKVEAITALERASYDEMVIFLQSQHEARFTM